MVVVLEVGAQLRRELFCFTMLRLSRLSGGDRVGKSLSWAQSEEGGTRAFLPSLTILIPPFTSCCLRTSMSSVRLTALVEWPFLSPMWGTEEALSEYA